jgi:uncharacterized protein
MEYVIVSIAALLVAALTLFSGFGLGTLLMPVLAIFFPVEIAVAATAIVHLANNIFKGILVGRHANMRVLLRFALPAVIAAFGIIAAFAGSFIGTRLIKKITMRHIQIIVGIMLLLLALALGSGII